MSHTPALLRRIQVPKTTRVWQLGTLSPATREVWITCHGYSQLAGRFVEAFRPIVSDTRAVLAPEGLHHFYLDSIDRPASERRVGATWMTREDRDADIADYVGYLDRLAADIARESPEARCIGFGFSQGGATISRWAVATATAPARVILWGSELPPDLDWEHAGARFREVPLTFVIGDRDEFASPERASRQHAILDRHRIPFETITFPGGHALDAETLGRLAMDTGRPGKAQV